MPAGAVSDKSTRRRLLSKILLPNLVAGIVLGRGSRPAKALDLQLPANLRSRLKRKKIPNAIKFPRKTVNDELAVACMRSLYSTVEDMEIVSMETYQKDFWMYRASLQPDYIELLDPLKPRIGDLTDPSYLDFISYSQFYVAGQKLEKAAALDGSVVETFESRLGQGLLTRLGVGLAAPEAGADAGEGEPAPPFLVLDSTSAQALVQGWIDYLAKRGYALKGFCEVVPSTSVGTTRLQVTWVGPTTLWGTEAFKGSFSKPILPLASAFDAYGTKALLGMAGYSVALEALDSDEKNTTQLWTLRKVS